MRTLQFVHALQKRVRDTQRVAVITSVLPCGILNETTGWHALKSIFNNCKAEQIEGRAVEE